MKRPKIALDLGYFARPQFEAFHTRQQRWACLVFHRRAGKTLACVMDLIDAALRSKKTDARFAYLAPTYAQAKDAAWGYLKRYTADIANVEQRESDLMVVFRKNGARVRLYGAENYDRLRGTYADGVVLDEYGDIDPRAWPEVIRPSLADRRGWAVFIGTPRGRNEFWRIHQEAENDPEWFSLVMRASQTGLLPQAELDDMRRMMTADQYDQELECSFDAAIRGAIYRSEFQTMDTDGRICSVPYDPSVPVWTGWDLGIGDATAIVCAQLVGREIHVIDYYEATGEPLTHYIAWLDSKPYRYSTDLLPHDAAARELGTGRTREELLRANGRKVRVVPRQEVDDGINAVKMILPRCWFDRTRTARLRECMLQYHRDFNDRMGVFKDAPVHDWSSHCLDGYTEILTRHGRCRIMDLPQTGEVLTPCGWKQYRNPRITLKNARLVEVLFTDGYSVKCTPDHLFLTDKGWISASDLRTDLQIQSTSIRSRSISAAAFTVFGRMRDILRAGAKAYIATCGLLLSATFPKGVTFTTETAIHSTTRSPILSAIPHTATYQRHGGVGSDQRSARLSTSRTRPEQRLLNGTGRTLADYGIAVMLKRAQHGRNGSANPSLATIAVRSLRHWFARMLDRIGSALTFASPLRIVRVVPLPDVADVWDITVPGVECFSLANGAVVHNSADAMRTLAMGLREALPGRVVPAPVVTRLHQVGAGNSSWMGA